VPFDDRDASGIGSLADSVRRRLYLYVCAQPTAVGRDEAAAAIGIPVHQAKFHLDKLEAEGVLDSDYVRLGGRTGPGAGRPSKVYRRADRDIAVSLPDREYQLAGRMMADAIAASIAGGRPVIEELHRIAVEQGRSWIDANSAPADAGAALEIAIDALSAHGYEPRREDNRVVMVNCPFHQLAQAQTQLVCTMNHALISGVTESLGPSGPTSELDPGTGRCCVVLREASA
jgi:predicted ArsR family transcriptional regulator